MPYKQGEIVLVPFPFTDLSTTKRRPGLVVSANWYNREESNCILVPITSTVHDPLARYEILVQGIEVKRAGLLYDSVIRAGHPFTIEQTLIIRSLGQVTLKQLASVVEHLQDTLHN